MRKLVKYPSPVLRAQTRRVSVFDSATRKLAQDMIKIMLESGGIGIAAPQVGSSVKMMICWDGNREKKPIILCNPEILSESEEQQEGPEGCLSFPGSYLIVVRPLKVKVKYHSLQGKLQTEEVDGLLARCVCHELDHLNGILFIDHSEEQWISQ